MIVMGKQYRLLALIVLVLGVGGCTNHRPEPLYYWGEYQNQVYGYFKGEKGPEDQILVCQSDVERAASKNQAVPPGFRAHLGVLYGKIGQTDKMVAQLEAEKQQFPESSTFMDFLLKKFKQ
jgi:hypothetical protein